MSEPASRADKAALLAIDRVRETHITALNQGDVEGWVGVFTEDAVQMPPNFPANTGRAMIRAWSEAFLGPLNVEFGLEVDEVHVAGDRAFERGRYRIRVTPKTGGESFPDAGKYITIYQKQANNAWLVARDIWNSDHPVPGMG